ncbi:hypothetical protein [Hymenobacter sp. 5516J-16]|nr:hypothetical protein [Hymenobacter sp. 5516J-16]
MQVSTLRVLMVLFVSVLLTACGPSIYMAQDFRSYAPSTKR